ncbi:MAG TPA: Ig-like domain-containing protein, partial [Nitrospira sp.]|nr:Ig-like domain-containing protein [Nitrospira sp.]
DATDSQLMFQNIGYLPNRPPVITPQTIRTHQDLEVTASLATMASDPDGDPVFYRLGGATFGVARLGIDGTSVTFMPEANYSGTASFDLVGDDGYGVSGAVSFGVGVSGAGLVGIRIGPVAPVRVGASIEINVWGDFADQSGVALSATYMSLTSLDPTVLQVTPGRKARALTVGDAVLMAERGSLVGVRSVEVLSEGQSSKALTDGLDVYPFSVALPTPNGQRQLKVGDSHDLDVHAASDGSRYFVGNRQLIDVTPDGLVVGKQAGLTLVSVVRRGLQVDVPVLVTPAVPDQTTIGIDGGAVGTDDGLVVSYGPGMLKGPLNVSLRSLSATELPERIPDGFTFVGAFDLDVGDVITDRAAHVTMPVGPEVAPGTDIYFYRLADLPTPEGGVEKVWLLAESGVVGSDGFARSASIPQLGVRARGTYLGAVLHGKTLVELESDNAWPHALVVGGFSVGFGAIFGAAGGAGAVLGGVRVGNRVGKLVAHQMFPLPWSSLGNAYDVHLYGKALTFHPNQVISRPISRLVGPGAGTVVPIGSSPPTAQPNTPLIDDIDTARLFSTPSLLTIKGDGFGTDPTKLEVKFDVAGVHAYAPVISSTLGAPQQELTIAVPDGLMLGLARISVVRQVSSTGVGFMGTTATPVSRESNFKQLGSNKQLVFSGVGPNRLAVIDVSTQELIAEVVLGGGASMSSTDPIAMTADGGRAYIGLRTGGFAIVDTVAMREADADPTTFGLNQITLDIDSVTPLPGMAALSCDREGRFLYAVGVGSASNVIYQVDIRPGSPTFNRVVAHIAIAVDDAPMGLKGLAVSLDGRRLYASAPRTLLTGGVGGKSWYDGGREEGKIIVLNVDVSDRPADPATSNPRKWHEIIDTLDAGFGPSQIVATSKNELLAFTNFLDTRRGLGTIEVITDNATAKDKPLEFKASVSFVNLHLGDNLQEWDLDIRNASAVAITEDLKYAFVTDWFVPGFPNRWTPTISEIESLRRSGSKIGIIENPFGIKDLFAADYPQALSDTMNSPRLIASTTPIFSGFADSIALSSNGRELLVGYRGSRAVATYNVSRFIPASPALHDPSSLFHHLLNLGDVAAVNRSRLVLTEYPIDYIYSADVKPRFVGMAGMPLSLDIVGQEKRTPVFLLPGIGAVTPALNDDVGWAMWFDRRGISPEHLVEDPISRQFDDLIATLGTAGYERGRDFFVANYDWRLSPAPSDPLGPGHPADGLVSGLSVGRITDGIYEFGVDYLGYWLKEAVHEYALAHNGEQLTEIDLIAHSTGGLVGRAYIQSGAYGTDDEFFDPELDRWFKLPKVRNFITLGVPNRGAAKAWNFLQDDWNVESSMGWPDLEYQLGLSKLLLPPWYKITQGGTVYGPDGDIGPVSDANDEVARKKFIRDYIPTLVDLLATYRFYADNLTVPPVAFSDTVMPEYWNRLLIDLNNGLDWTRSAGDPDVNRVLLDRLTKLTVVYGLDHKSDSLPYVPFMGTVGWDTPFVVQRRSDWALFKSSVLPFSDFVRNPAGASGEWFKILMGDGDFTVPRISAVGQFSGISDSRVELFPIDGGLHVGLNYDLGVQRKILDVLGYPLSDDLISTDLHVESSLLKLPAFVVITTKHTPGTVIDYSADVLDDASRSLVSLAAWEIRTATELVVGLTEQSPPLLGSAQFVLRSDTEADFNYFVFVSNGTAFDMGLSGTVHVGAGETVTVPLEPLGVSQLHIGESALLDGRSEDEADRGAGPTDPVGLASKLEVGDLGRISIAAGSLWVKSGVVSAASADPQINVLISDLPEGNLSWVEAAGLGGAVIRVDQTADGHGWFVDPTPTVNEEFWWNQSSGEWWALPGGPADGRVDLLTTLAHEIGHELGLPHSDPNVNPLSVMVTPLAPGVRRVPTLADLNALGAVQATLEPTASETDLLADVAQQAYGLVVGADFMQAHGARQPLLLSSGPMSAKSLTNGDFSLSDLAADGFGWILGGTSIVEGGVLILREESALNTRASQTFVIPDGAQSLRFTLHSATLGATTGAPEDALEVALLGAETLLPVAGTVGLAGSDSLFNLQADSRLSTGARVLLNGLPPGAVLPQGPATVDIDLTGIATDKPIRLFFDLLGFGAADSEVTIDDVEFVMPPNTAPLAVNDLITVDEDSVIRFDVRLNDSDAQGDRLTVEVLTSPQQGTLIAEADGSFSYRPAADFHGEDLFTYRVNDGSLKSASATVGLVVRAVNDAPT